jgi:hypothetical protein
MDDNKAKALSAALSQIEKQFGKGSIMRLGDGEVESDIQTVSTGSLGLDIALGIGGLPRGRVVESTAPNPPARPPSRCRSWPKCRSSAAPPPSSTPNTRWTSPTPRSSASTSASC